MRPAAAGDDGRPPAAPDDAEQVTTPGVDGGPPGPAPVRRQRPSRPRRWSPTATGTGPTGGRGARVDEPDPATIRAAAAGDLDAFEDLVAAYQAPVWRFLRRFVGDPILAEDLTQETFLRVFRRLDTYRFGSRFSTWTIQIARNAAIDAMRSRERRDRLVEVLTPPPPTGAPGLGAELDAALATLSPKLRDAVLLVDAGGFPYAEAAAVLGVPVGTVKSRVSQARSQLVAWFDAGDVVVEGSGTGDVR
jgi:RNA polymerase sigma-70 factor (ECF subfamily)